MFFFLMLFFNCSLWAVSFSTPLRNTQSYSCVSKFFTAEKLKLQNSAKNTKCLTYCAPLNSKIITRAQVDYYRGQAFCDTKILSFFFNYVKKWWLFVSIFKTDKKVTRWSHFFRHFPPEFKNHDASPSWLLQGPGNLWHLEWWMTEKVWSTSNFFVSFKNPHKLSSLFYLIEEKKEGI